MIDNADYTGRFTNVGKLTKAGPLTQILSGQNSTVDAVDVTGGTLKFMQSGDFNTTGDYTTRAGATTDIGLNNSTLNIGGTFSQAAGSGLNVALPVINNSPVIRATDTNLDGSLHITGFVAADALDPIAMQKASTVDANEYHVIASTNAISGDFSSPVAGLPAVTAPDYLLVNGHKIPGDLGYDVGLELAWTAANPAERTGSFTVAAGTGFNVDIALADETVSGAAPNAGWDGRSLTKDGDGTLALSAQNTYTGATTVNGGILLLNAADAIAASDSVAVNSMLYTNGNDQHLQHLSGADTGVIVLGTGDLTAYNDAGRDTAYAGDIAGAGQLTKTGAGQLTLSGDTAWTGGTHLDGGTLTLDGQNGGARLVSDIYGQDNTALRLINGATLTGKIDPTDVAIDPGSRWTMTADSIVNNLSNGGSIVFVPPAAGSGFKTLHVEGILAGNGALYMNTNLAALQGDLVVAQETEGSHTVYITNQGGEPTGPGQSLKIIDVSAPSLSKGTFALNGGKVDAGAYRYDLLPGGKVAGGDAGDWYLTNTMEKSNLTNDVIAAANAAKYATFASLNSLHKRLGELRLDQGIEGDLWTRAYRKDYTLDLGSRIDQRVGGLEVGADRLVRFNGGRFYAGGLIGAGQSDASSDTNDSGESRNHQMGAYGTWILDNGLYVDLIGRYFWFKRDYRTLQAGATEYETGSSHNTAMSLDVETGKRFDFKDGWFLEPQAELNWLRNSQTSFTSSQGNQVTIESGQTLNGRLGLAGGKVLTSESGRLTQLYSRLDWSKDLSSDGRVSVNGNSFDAVKDDGSWIAALGVQTAGGDRNRLQLHAEVEAELGSCTVKQNWGVNVGLRWAF
ncbi:MAG: autotransporter outer membrane beta-barrel domain-containing protein [Desulfocapsaceae bacterium]|nr:autotransporter outer membrane beta-barrel domain-containing protein [Desulfocapsaceae bacterium]